MAALQLPATTSLEEAPALLREIDLSNRKKRGLV